jgi:WD repeat-containing protein 48
LKSEKSNNNDNFSSSSLSSNINKTNNNISSNTTTTATSNKNTYLNEATNNLIDNNNKLNKSTSSSSSFMTQQPLNTQPLITIKGTTSIKQYTILNDKRYIVTKDSDDNVCVWDVLQARKTETLGKENYENAIKIRQRFISIPNWFTVDLKLGVLTINLDENDWQSAWINFKDMDHNHVRHTQNCDLSDAKVNYGCIFLESLFKNCLFINPSQIQICNTVIVSSQQQQQQNSENNGKEDDKLQAGLLRFNIPEHVPIIFSEVAGRTLHRIEVKDLTRDSEQHTLSNVMPLWIIDALHGVNILK